MRSSIRPASLFFLSTIAALAACGGELADRGGGGAGAGGGSGGSPIGDESFPLACDPLVPSFCGYPFPSDARTVDDPQSPTGRRIGFKAAGLPKGKDGYEQDPAVWNRLDGFSAGSAIVTEIPGATEEGLVGWEHLEASLEDGATTVLLDEETGERVLHFAELDRSKDLDTTPSLLIHPAVPLRDGARYIVAIRGLVDGSGAPIEATEAFASLRDGTASDHPSIEARRDRYEEIFQTLGDAGVGRDDLLLAWDFTTASREGVTGALVHMRDEALEMVGEAGPAYTITSVDSDLDPENILYRIHGTMTVPLYLDTPDPGAALILGDDGLPTPNPDMPTYEADWELLIPKSAENGPVGLLQHGHGLLGSDGQIEAENFRTFCNQYGYAVFSTRLIGMADDDQEWIVDQLVHGRLDQMFHMFDRLHQGFLNNLLVMRMVAGGLANDPTYGAYLDPSRRYYWGISQGGIQGGVTMALSEDISRGLLEVMGQPYDLLLNRSADFAPFFVVATLEFPDSRDQQHMLGLLQMGWDHVEPDGYTKHIFTEPFAGSPPDRRILLRAAIGDHQVTTVGAHIMARAMGAKHLDTGLRQVFGLDAPSGNTIDEDGAVYAEYDFGLPAEPSCNRPFILCDDPHGKLRKLEPAREQADIFFKTGVAENRCENLVCDESDQSGCTGDEDPDVCD